MMIMIIVQYFFLCGCIVPATSQESPPETYVTVRHTAYSSSIAAVMLAVLCPVPVVIIITAVIIVVVYCHRGCTYSLTSVTKFL